MTLRLPGSLLWVLCCGVVGFVVGLAAFRSCPTFRGAPSTTGETDVDE